MRILVFSDSHGRMLNVYDLIEREQPDAIIHLGDYCEDACELRRSYPDIPVYAVRGNNDYDPDVPNFLVIAPAGVRMYLTHGHRERVAWSSTGRVGERAAAHGCTLALYGHTHLRLDAIEQGVRVMNPGSISLPRDGAASCLRLTAEDGVLRQAEFLDAEGNVLHPESPDPEKKKFRWF